MKYFILCALDQPQSGEWSECAEFCLFDTEKEADEEFQKQIVDNEYPYIASGSLSAEGVARIEIERY